MLYLDKAMSLPKTFLEVLQPPEGMVGYRRRARGDEGWGGFFWKPPCSGLPACVRVSVRSWAW